MSSPPDPGRPVGAPTVEDVYLVVGRFLFGLLRGRVAMEGPRVLGREAVRPVPVPVGVDCLHRTAPSF